MIDFDEEPGSKLSRKINISVQAREAPSELVSTSGSQRGPGMGKP